MRSHNKSAYIIEIAVRMKMFVVVWEDSKRSGANSPPNKDTTKNYTLSSSIRIYFPITHVEKNDIIAYNQIK